MSIIYLFISPFVYFNNLMTLQLHIIKFKTILLKQLETSCTLSDLKKTVLLKSHMLRTIMFFLIIYIFI